MNGGKTRQKSLEMLNGLTDMEKRFTKVVTNPETGRKKTVRFGQKGATISPGSKRGDSYCARSAKINGDWKSDPNSPNALSRKKWRCKGSKSMK